MTPHTDLTPHPAGEGRNPDADFLRQMLKAEEDSDLSLVNAERLRKTAEKQQRAQEFVRLGVFGSFSVLLVLMSKLFQQKHKSTVRRPL